MFRRNRVSTRTEPWNTPDLLNKKKHVPSSSLTFDFRKIARNSSTYFLNTALAIIQSKQIYNKQYAYFNKNVVKH